MLSISCTHPDLEEFIEIKKDLNKVNAANISVRITDDFMRAVECDLDWDLYFRREETGEEIRKRVKAKNIYHNLAKNNWDMAEPGILFWDRIEQSNLLSNTPEFKYSGTNPCAEEPLPNGGSCLLGSINLSEFVKDDGDFDFDDLAEVVFTATCALNDVLDEGLPLHPLEEQRQSVKEWRQIGLGVMGVADMLIKMGIRYGSNEAIEISKTISNFILNYALLASATLAIYSGPYEHYNYNYVSSTQFYKANVWGPTDKAIQEHGLRNSQLLTIAPTGTLSTMLGISGGIEPIFANSYERKTQSLHGEDVSYKVYTPIVKEYMDRYGIDDESKLPDFFVTSHDIPYIDRIRMQAAWQQSIDASISSTINLPHETTVEDVERLYFEAWKNNLKGVTIFRDMCRRSPILSENKNTIPPLEERIDKDTVLKRGEIIETSSDVVGKKRKLITGCGSLHCCAFFDKKTGELMETYLSKGSTGGCQNFMIGLSRMISLSARAGVSIDAICDQLNSCGACPSYASRFAVKHDTSKGSCCPMAVGNALREMRNEMKNELTHTDFNFDTNNNNTSNLSTGKTDKCPECGNNLTYEGGCRTCKSCGWSKCE